MENPPRNPGKSEQRLKQREFKEKLERRIRQLEQMMEYCTRANEPSSKKNSKSKTPTDDSLTKFTTKMMVTDVFRCSTCHNLLKPPIMLMPEHGGNICSVCWQTNLWTTGTPNLEMELILNELKFPCKFHSLGCMENVQYKDMESHESACKYHPVECLLSGEGCEWQGVRTNFAGHFIEKHPEHTVDSNTNQFDMEIDLIFETDMVKLLKGRKQTCVMRIRNSLISDSISYAVHDVTGSSTASDNLECIIKHKGQTSNSIESVCGIQPLMNSDFAEFTCGAQINLTVLKQVIQAEHAVTLFITINSSNEVQELDEQMLQVFECPVCKNLMKPPIYQCKFGHSFCNVCKPKLEKCPTCRGILGKSRNYSLEDLTSRIQYNCIYHDLGCEEILEANDCNEHEALCIYKPYRCPLKDCTFTANYTTLISHLKNIHPGKVVTTNCHYTTMEYRMDQIMDFLNFQRRLIMVFDENIFRLSLKRDIEETFWAVEVLRKTKENAVFIYEIGIVDMKKSDKRLIRTDLCHKECDPDKLFEKCIVLPNNMISSYVSQGRFNYYCRVYKSK